MSSITGLFTHLESNSSNSVTTMAPTKAAATVESEENSAESGVLMVDNEPTPSSMTMATPSEAPLVMPKMPGPASGLRKAVCKSSPLTANAAPQSIAVRAAGRRDSITMKCQDADCGSAPRSIANTSAAGMLAEPMKRLSTNSTIMSSTIEVHFTVSQVGVTGVVCFIVRSVCNDAIVAGLSFHESGVEQQDQVAQMIVRAEWHFLEIGHLQRVDVIDTLGLQSL